VVERGRGRPAARVAERSARWSRQMHGDFFIRPPSAIAMNDKTVQWHVESPGQWVFAALASELPALPKREDPLPDVQEAFVPSKTVPFEDAAQQGFSVLAWRRDNLEFCWRDVRTRLV
jgi:hypothetical protein